MVAALLHQAIGAQCGIISDTACYEGEVDEGYFRII